VGTGQTGPVPLSPSYTMLSTAPTLDDYLRLRHESGLSPKTPEQATGALGGSWTFRHVVSADGETVAMGRVVGDGGWYFLIADMATLPAHQGNGLGSAVLDSALDEIRTRAPKGAYITLTADPPGRRLYESRGFVDVAPGRTGMHLILE
jgi:GNAT superfamily N-acetyltransferase